MEPNVPCPKCRGGCDLCGGAGLVTDGVARIYNREESRATMPMRPRTIRNLWSSEMPTRPDVIKRVERRLRIIRYALLALGLVALVFVALWIVRR